MYKINFKEPIHVHFIGIGGISMSGLAEILLKENFTISGSDNQDSSLLDELRRKNVQIDIGQKASNIREGIDLVVYTAAVHEDNEEYAAAKNKGLPMLSRAELLGQLMENYDVPIAVAGTHGKTTTTSMLSHILLEGEKDPTISVGGILPSINGNIKVGGNNLFLTEACEYTNSFLHFFPKISIILNIDEDHLDFFKDLDDIYQSFLAFSKLLPEDGTLVINGDIEGLSLFTGNVSAPLLTYGIGEGYDCYAKNIVFDSMGCPSFDAYYKDEAPKHITLSVHGEHNVGNALASIATARLIDTPWNEIQKGLTSFTGTNRRFEKKGERNGVTIIDDYAHHPTEIKATLKAANAYPHREIWCIFQPHTYSRTKALFQEFADTLSLSDHIILTKIYAARETDTLGVSSEDLAEQIKKKGKNAYYFETFEEIENFCIENCKKGDMLITMGAGNVVTIGESILNH
ncbi:UDP-N-acetylmuramate--alanine ligase [Aequitasia blattaphilus]|uniref:UDP-N-acetylmuramate--L-alanine ligase n=1 Tax=Aequitasia blattaphilus TaxID=2949332 RepID=A0ABT1E9P7_9FIRM|nr:UDP-N-acetylmuramate--L-alanine ligase [Aequitasia blattaphilus]MCP1102560.1 UDP-N-acetylmuramate--L-alanine ligase [Aequitasia blattaphilus]MCR8615200.1 UDP-N-acetylmuramate--L-alanine ligase [Aequitasia blattaphilus]